MSDNRIEPVAVVQAVETYVTEELGSAGRYDNRTPLDDSGVWSLHAVAARIYAMGWDDGERSAVERQRGERQRRDFA